MRIIVGKKEIVLVESDIKAAKEMIAHFTETVKEKCEEKQCPALYYTTLVLMHLMSRNMIDAITPESLEQILEANYRSHIRAKHGKDIFEE